MDAQGCCWGPYQDMAQAVRDPVLVAEVLALVAELKHEGMTMLVATHEMGFALRVADQVGFLHHGVLLECGVPAQVIGAPQTPELQDFLRSIKDAGRL